MAHPFRDARSSRGGVCACLTAIRPGRVAVRTARNRGPCHVVHRVGGPHGVVVQPRSTSTTWSRRQLSSRQRVEYPQVELNAPPEANDGAIVNPRDTTGVAGQLQHWLWPASTEHESGRLMSQVSRDM